jgi:hypothetical protein
MTKSTRAITLLAATISLVALPAYADVAPPPVCPGEGKSCTGQVPAGTDCVGGKCLQQCANLHEGCCGYGTGWPCGPTCQNSQGLCVPAGGKAYCVSVTTCGKEGAACTLMTGLAGTCKRVDTCGGFNDLHCIITPPADAGVAAGGDGGIDVPAPATTSGGCATSTPVRGALPVLGALLLALGAGAVVRRRR